MTEKLDQKLDQVEIKQTRSETDKLDPIRFKDEAINKIRKQNIVWGKRNQKSFLCSILD